MCQKSLRNWIVTLCNKIIICIPILTLDIKIDHISIFTRRIVITLGRLHPMIAWPHEVTWLIKNDISPLLRGLWLPHLSWWRFIVNGHHPSSHLTLWLRDQVITWQMKNVIFQLPRDHGYQNWVVDFNAGLLFIKSHNLLMMWSHKVTWQMKNVINLLSRGLSLSNLT